MRFACCVMSEECVVLTALLCFMEFSCFTEFSCSLKKRSKFEAFALLTGTSTTHFMDRVFRRLGPDREMKEAAVSGLEQIVR